MKHFVVLSISFALLLAGCNGKKAQNKESESTAESAEKSNLVEMSVSAQEHIGMQVAPAALTQLNEYLRATGTVQPIDSRIGVVGPLARGRIMEVRAKVGDRVGAGQTLAIFDNIEAGELLSQEQSARADLERLKAQLIPAARQVERSRRLADIGAGAEKDFESSKAEKEGIEANIRSQESLIEGIQSAAPQVWSLGWQSSRNISHAIEGAFLWSDNKSAGVPWGYCGCGTDVFTVADLTQVWVQAEVYEKDLGRIRVGQSAFITVDTYPDHPFEGKVSYIGDALDPQTRTARVRCEVSNHDLRLKTDMFANIELPTKFSKQAIAVPSAALQVVEGKNVVFIRHSHNSV